MPQSNPPAAESIEQLAAQLLARMDWRREQREGPPPPSRTISIWERWIVDEPERAWPLFLELVRLRPEDVEVLELVWQRLRLLLSRHTDAFHARAVELVESNAILRGIAPAAELEVEHYRPEPLDVPALVEAYIAHLLHAEDASELESLAKHRPDAALPLVLEVIARGPLHGLSSADTADPLKVLLRENAPHVMEAVERAAAESVAVRRCLWQATRHRGHPPEAHELPEEVWQRARAAAGATGYTSDDTPGEAHALQPDEERTVNAWFVHETTWWAADRVFDAIYGEPELAWEVLLRTLAHPDAEPLLGFLGAGIVEDVVREQGVVLIDRIEREARENPTFFDALGCVWMDRGELPPDIEARVVAASGGHILLFDPPADEDRELGAE